MHINPGLDDDRFILLTRLNPHQNHQKRKKKKTSNNKTIEIAFLFKWSE